MHTYRITANVRALGSPGPFSVQVFYLAMRSASDQDVAGELNAQGFELHRFTVEVDRVNEGFQIGDTVRSSCGRAAASFHPEFSRAAPWVCYVGDGPGQQFHGLSGAMRHLASKGYRFTDAA